MTRENEFNAFFHFDEGTIVYDDYVGFTKPVGSFYADPSGIAFQDTPQETIPLTVTGSRRMRGAAALAAEAAMRTGVGLVTGVGTAVGAATTGAVCTTATVWITSAGAGGFSAGGSSAGGLSAGGLSPPPLSPPPPPAVVPFSE